LKRTATNVTTPQKEKIRGSSAYNAMTTETSAMISVIKPVFMVVYPDQNKLIVNIAREGNDGRYEVYNQLVEYVRIRELAEELNKAAEEITGSSPGIDFIPNPRKEKEESEYKFDNRKFLRIIKPKHTEMAKTLPEVIEKLQKYSDTIKSHKDVFIR